MHLCFTSEWWIAFARAAVSFGGALRAQQFVELDAIEFGHSGEQILKQFEHGECLFRRPVVGHDERQTATAPRWQQGAAHHTVSLFVAGLRVLRCLARASFRSRASLSRYDSPSIEITSARCTRQSTSYTTQAAFGNTSDHSLNGLLVVTMVERASYRRLTSSNSKSAWRFEYER
ncbi:hypothetical protein WK13_32715 [Burkholderia ubonensis]|nr:hypothetical protein WK13_32715 [Burkholderia ubonensis]